MFQIERKYPWIKTLEWLGVGAGLLLYVLWGGGAWYGGISQDPILQNSVSPRSQSLHTCAHLTYKQYIFYASTHSGVDQDLSLLCICGGAKLVLGQYSLPLPKKCVRNFKKKLNGFCSTFPFLLLASLTVCLVNPQWKAQNMLDLFWNTNKAFLTERSKKIHHAFKKVFLGYTEAAK